jgi:hypothetical protein
VEPTRGRPGRDLSGLRISATLPVSVLVRDVLRFRGVVKKTLLAPDIRAGAG